MNSLLAHFIFLERCYPQICLFLAVAWKSSLIVMLGWSLASLLRRRAAVARCWVWRCTLLGIFAILAFDFGPNVIRRIRPAIAVSMDPAQMGEVWQHATALRIVRSGEEIQKLSQAKRAAWREKANPAPWQEDGTGALTQSDIRPPIPDRIETCLPIVWWSLAGGLLMLSAMRVLSGILWLRHKATDADPVLREICHRVAAELGIRSRPILRISPRLGSPLLLGIFRPVVYLPADASTWPGEKLRAVFLHEFAHAKRRDNLWQYAGRIGACLLWWNPLVAFGARQMGMEAEEAADDSVLAQQGQAESYAKVLVEIAAGTHNGRASVAGVSMIGHRALEKRIKALLRNNPWRGRIGRWPAVAIVSLLLLFVAGTSVYFGSAADQAPKAPPAPALSPEMRAALERIVQSSRKRLADWHYLHFKLESTSTETENGKSKKTPQPTVMEAWVDEWTGIHRAEYRPRVSPWTGGAAPFYITNATEINNGKESYSWDSGDDLDDLHGSEPEGLGYYLGITQLTDLARIADSVLHPNSKSDGIMRRSADEEMRGGKKFIRIREEFFRDGKVAQRETFLVDPAQGDLLVSREMAFPASRPNEPSSWTVLKAGKLPDGTLYPQEYQTISSSEKQTTTTLTKVVEFQPLSALPAGITDLPKPANELFVAKNGTPVLFGKIAITCVNAADQKPVAQVALRASLNNEQPRKLSPNAEGQFVLPLPKDEIEVLSIEADAAGFVPQIVTWRKYGDPLQLPQAYTVKLSPCVPISGRVLNEDGQPIAGAQVSLWISGVERRNWGTFVDRHKCSATLKTDASGAWTFKDAPEDLTGLHIQVSAGGYRPTSTTMDDFRTITGLDYPSLRNGTADIKLDRGLALAGQILDHENRPVEKARVTIGRDRWGIDLPTAETDASGKFTFSGLSPDKSTWLTVESPTHQPFVRKISIPAAPLTIHLEPGRILRVRVVKEDGSPCAGLNVEADRWRTLRTLTFHTQTDASGRFVWSGAPEDAVTFDFGGCQNREFLCGLPLTVEDGEITAVIKPALRLTASVIDKLTGKPIEAVRMTSGRITGPDGRIYWEQNSAKTYAEGGITWKTSYMEDQNYVFRLEAEGYEPFQSREFAPNQRSFTETFAMVPLSKSATQK